MRLIQSLIRPYRGRLFLILLAMLVETVMNLAAPWPIKIILDNVVARHRLPRFLEHFLASPFAQSFGQGKLQIAAFAALSVLVIAILNAAASYLDNYYTEYVGQCVAHDLRMRMYDHLQRLSLTYYDTHRTGALLSTITSDIQTIQSFSSSSTLGVVVDFLTILEMLGLMFWLNWDFTLIALGFTPILLFVMSRVKRAVKDATRDVRLRQADIVSVVQEGLESMRVVKAFGQEELEESKVGGASLATLNASLKARRVKAVLSPVVNVAVAVCTTVVLWRGAVLILQDRMTAGALIVFLAYLTRFFKPLQDLAKITNAFAQTTVAIERVQEVLDADTVIPEEPNARDLTSVTGKIDFHSVGFAYDPSAPILNDVSLQIQPGQRIGFVGPTGSGKSTLVSLIARFYDTTAGKITLDGVDVRQYRLRSLRNQIGFVLQDTALFQGTIRENIAFGRPSATPEEIEKAAELANASEFINRMPHAYDSVVGERGATLSGGQRQRIGIARAIVRNSPILILDEPTAALDAESEKLVMEAMERLMEGRTVITIAHRLSTIRDADQIVVLKNGEIVERGKHEELLRTGGMYAQLYGLQTEGKQAPSAAPASDSSEPKNQPEAACPAL